MRDDRGFALLEVIVAAALLVTLAAGASRIIAAALREGHASRLRAVAMVAAAGKIEELRSLPPADVAGGADYLDTAGAVVGGGLSLPRSAVYVRRWSVQPLDGDADTLAVRVDVSTRDGALTARLTTVRAAR
jgi:prepilin-type N-terminal cleavage/methylation domain-containing protein